MNAKGMYFPETLTIPQYKQVLSKNFAAVIPYPFATVLPTAKEQAITIEVWRCRNCVKDYSENCGNL